LSSSFCRPPMFFPPSCISTLLFLFWPPELCSAFPRSSLWLFFALVARPMKRLTEHLLVALRRQTHFLTVPSCSSSPHVALSFRALFFRRLTRVGRHPPYKRTPFFSLEFHLPSSLSTFLPPLPFSFSFPIRTKLPSFLTFSSYEIHASCCALAATSNIRRGRNLFTHTFSTPFPFSFLLVPPFFSIVKPSPSVRLSRLHSLAALSIEMYLLRFASPPFPFFSPVD